MKKIPRWRYWLSHIWEQPLEVKSSEFNEYLQVSLVKGRFQLTAKEAIYSFGDYYLNFRKTFQRFQFDQLPSQADVLILGLGLGSIPDMLTNTFGRSYHFTAVEIDPIIVELAATYSLPQINANIEVITSDALTFLQLDARQYDLICMDVFQDAEVPPQFEDPAFLELLKRSLQPKGALIFNRLAANV
ncbi:MAG: fused MFS/spermidine synthase, partial [Bacteroidota bacterium]